MNSLGEGLVLLENRTVDLFVGDQALFVLVPPNKFRLGLLNLGPEIYDFPLSNSFR